MVDDREATLRYACALPSTNVSQRLQAYIVQLSVRCAPLTATGCCNSRMQR